jgi:hypothetical protein
MAASSGMRKERVVCRACHEVITFSVVICHENAVGSDRPALVTCMSLGHP